MPVWLTFSAIFFSGIVGVAATVAYNFWAEHRRLRIDCLRQLMRYGTRDDAFWRAFNEAPVIFSGRPRVLKAHMDAVETINRTNDAVGEHISAFVRAVATDMRMAQASERQLMARFSVPKE